MKSERQIGLWEVTYTITPNRGYFDRAEATLWEHDVYFRTIQSMEFLDDGSVVIRYEVDGPIDALRRQLERATEKVIEYAVTTGDDRQILHLWFRPDETLQRNLEAATTLGTSIEFPATYLDHDPATLELTETGPRAVLRKRIAKTRDTADVHVDRLTRYEPNAGQLYQSLTTRQREVLCTAVELGYYEHPRGTTHEEIAAELGCSKSVVGQHLRRVERRILTSIVPECATDSEPIAPRE